MAIVLEIRDGDRGDSPLVFVDMERIQGRGAEGEPPVGDTGSSIAVPPGVSRHLSIIRAYRGEEIPTTAAPLFVGEFVLTGMDDGGLIEVKQLKRIPDRRTADRDTEPSRTVRLFGGEQFTLAEAPDRLLRALGLSGDELFPDMTRPAPLLGWADPFDPGLKRQQLMRDAGRVVVIGTGSE
jgi:hypothetical protein